MSLTCPRCGWANVRPSKSSGFMDVVSSSILLSPYRCRTCRHRFYRYFGYAKDWKPECQDSPAAQSVAWPPVEESCRMAAVKSAPAAARGPKRKLELGGSSGSSESVVRELIRHAPAEAPAPRPAEPAWQTAVAKVLGHQPPAGNGSAPMCRLTFAQRISEPNR